MRCVGSHIKLFPCFQDELLTGNIFLGINYRLKMFPFFFLPLWLNVYFFIVSQQISSSPENDFFVLLKKMNYLFLVHFAHLSPENTV